MAKTYLEKYVEAQNAWMLETDPKKRLALCLEWAKMERPPVGEFGWGE